MNFVLVIRSINTGKNSLESAQDRFPLCSCCVCLPNFSILLLDLDWILWLGVFTSHVWPCSLDRG